jgi:hypothetical protein
MSKSTHVRTGPKGKAVRQNAAKARAEERDARTHKDQFDIVTARTRAGQANREKRRLIGIDHTLLSK